MLKLLLIRLMKLNIFKKLVLLVLVHKKRIGLNLMEETFLKVII